ncbi:MAG: helix-turn-helix domain-containing protein [Flavisolibacter sp.]
MFFKKYQPHFALREFVNNIMIQQADLDPSTPRYVFPMPPLQEQVLIFYPYDPVAVEHLSDNRKVETKQNIIVARRINRVNLHISYHHLIVQVGFQPGGLYRLLGIPMCELEADEGYDSTSLFDKEIKFITEELNEASSFENMAAIVERYLLTKLDCFRAALPIDSVLPEFIKKGGLISIDEMASESCVSLRQFERLFQQRIGVAPKFYARLIRFTKAWVYKEGHPKESWTGIAHQFGYFDQMHLIHDFKEFTGVAPSIIVNELSKTPYSLNHKLSD